MRVFYAAILIFTCIATNALAKPELHSSKNTRANVIPAERVDRVISALLVKSDEMWHQGDYDTTVFMLKMVTELDPSDVNTWGNRAWILWAGMQKDEEAFKVLKEGIAANPKRYELYFDTATLYDHRKEYSKAIPYYKKALSLGSPPIYRHALAHAQELSGQIQEAKKTWQEVLKANPKDEAARNNLSRLERGEIHKPQESPLQVPATKDESSKDHDNQNITDDVSNIE